MNMSFGQSRSSQNPKGNTGYSNVFCCSNLWILFNPFQIRKKSLKPNSAHFVYVVVECGQLDMSAPCAGLWNIIRRALRLSFPPFDFDYRYAWQ